MALKSETPVYAIVAAIAGQFPGMENNKIRGAFQALGFTDVREVAVGCRFVYGGRSKGFLEEVRKNCRLWLHPVARPGL